MTSEDFEKRAWEHFFMRKPLRFELDEIRESDLLHGEMRLAFTIFKATLDEIVGAVQAFYLMAMAGVIEVRLNRRQMANTLRVKADFIRKGKEQDDAEIEREARRRTNEEWDREDHEKELLHETAKRLLGLSASSPELVAQSNYAILRQSSVMLWSATENLLREYFRISVNLRPSLSKDLFESSEAKRFWNCRDLTIDVIQSADFNLGECMGDVMLEINPMISLKSIKAAYAVICENNESLQTALKANSTYNLFSLRNLVAHRNGLVDEKFLAETNFKHPVGEKFTISPALFEELFMASKTIGTKLFEGAKSIV